MEGIFILSIIKILVSLREEMREEKNCEAVQDNERRDDSDDRSGGRTAILKGEVRGEREEKERK